MTQETETVSQRALQAAAALALSVYGARIAKDMLDGTIERHHFFDAFARFEHELSTNKDETIAKLRDALDAPWSWGCPEGGAHCCCECDTCCDCDRPRSITPDLANAKTCIENVLESYALYSVSDADGPVDTVVNSGDLFVILSLAGAAYAARALTSTKKEG